MLAPLGIVFFMSIKLQTMKASTAQALFWVFSALSLNELPRMNGWLNKKTAARKTSRGNGKKSLLFNGLIILKWGSEGHPLSV